MSEVEVAPFTLRDVKTLDRGPAPPYVINLPAQETEGGISIPAVEALCIPILSRQNGLLLALPMDTLPTEVLESQEPPLPHALIGPAREFVVQTAMDDENGQERELEMEMGVLVVDFDAAVLTSLRMFDPVTEGDGIRFFLEGDMEAYPSSQSLLKAVQAWLEEAHEERVAFYSAEETEPPKAKVAPAKPGRAKPPSTARRVTTATLSQQLAALSETIPALSSSLAQMQRRQEEFEVALQSQASLQQSAPHQRDFGAHLQMPLHTAASPAKFLSQVGPPPRQTQALRQPALRSMREDEPAELPEEQDPPIEGADQVSQMLLQQQQALNLLVSHIANQDGLPDLGSTSAGSSAISLKGSARREKLQAELAARKGGFFLKIAQNAFRRLKPSDPVPGSIQEFQKKAIFTKYLERQGGYTGYQRDLGLVMWLLSHVADQMLAGDQAGAQEMLALAMVAIEQSAMDGGKWEVAWILSLQEDPPTQIFSHRPQHTNPRLRAFGPLCPADWGATALAYVKELDLLNTRRSEALPKKPGGGPHRQEDEGQETAKPKQPRYPRRPKKAASPAQTEGA